MPNVLKTRKPQPIGPIVPAQPPQPIGLIAIIGTNTASGKTTLANATANFFASALVPTRVLRIEAAERRGEFSPNDLFIDANRASEIANLVGGAAGLFDDVWESMRGTILQQGVALIDCGAGAQNLMLQAAAAACLDDLIGELGAQCAVIVVTTPDPEGGRQAVQLIATTRDAMPQAQLMLAVTHVTAQQEAGVAVAQSAFRRVIADLKDVIRIDVPFARGQSIDCFKGAAINEILEADDEKLMRWTGQGQLSSRGAQTQLIRWYRDISDRLAKVFWR